MSSTDLTFEKGLPVNVDAERFVLGAILVDDSAFINVAGVLEAGDFSMEKHRRIFLRMMDLNQRGERIDRVTLANELIKNNQLESVDGLGYLVTLDEGLPQISNLDSYVRIVKDKALLRRIIFTSQKLIDRCLLGTDDADQILAGAEETLLKLGEARSRDDLSTPKQIIENYEGGINSFLDPSKRIKGLSTGFTKF
ncbi:MAG: DnaB-like helicase N-terminal domain-containing protein, partial [Bryobacteraceae bacterium]